jgi:predicted ATP-grasp superfamily ATP-dependent carboligase
MAEVLVVGLSARALSQSARSAGYDPLAADFFCDLDTQESAKKSQRVNGSLARGFEWQPLAQALQCLAANQEPVGVVCGSGFEDRAELLDRLAEWWPLLGNPGTAVARMSEPATLAGLCAELGIPHPRWSATPRNESWLTKRAGGSGGSHVANGHRETLGRYWQERVEGEPVSALVLGNGAEALVIGLSAQWADPDIDSPYRYGGALRPVDLAPAVGMALSDAARRIVTAAGLVGLNSVDFLLTEHAWHLIEVNPRPAATMDIFRPVGGSLFALHVEACRGSLPSRPPVFEGGAAARIVYARRYVASVPEFRWPDWAADRQPPGTSLQAGEPLCTVTAFAPTAAEARQLVEERGRAVSAALGAD